MTKPRCCQLHRKMSLASSSRVQSMKTEQPGSENVNIDKKRSRSLASPVFSIFGTTASCVKFVNVNC